MAKKSSLGCGLSELLSGVKLATEALPTKSTKIPELQHFPLEWLQPGRYQPRQNFASESLAELAASMRTQGVLQPLVVREIEQNRYEIIAGERRWRAAQLAGIAEVPVIVKKLTDREAMAIALIENVQRENLNAIDMALGIERLIKEFSLTHEEAAEIIGKTRSVVTNLLRILTLPHEVKELVKNGELEMGHARALLALPVKLQLKIAHEVSNKRLSVRECEALVKRLLTPRAPKKAIDANILGLVRELSSKLASEVAIINSAKNSGKIVIKYHDLDELNGIIRHIK